MGGQIDYWFTVVSPWAYLGHEAFRAIARRHAARVRYRPVNLGVVFPETGGLPLAKRHPARQRYRLVELQRWREKRGIPLNLRPAHFPVDPTRADRTVIALAESGGEPGDLALAFMRAVWVEDRDIADRATLEAIVAEAGHDAAALLSVADSAGVAALYEGNAAAAIAADVFGSPSYVRDGEVFWGQDRLELLDDALAAGRPAFAADGS